MYRRCTLLVVTAILVLGSAPLTARPAELPLRTMEIPRFEVDSRYCSGTAPVKRSCSVTGSFRNAPYGVVVRPGIGFTGNIVASVSTTSGFHTEDCEIVASPLFRTCRRTTSGGFYAGQVYTLTADVDGVGQWEVGVVN